jgi:hypothetical protein
MGDDISVGINFRRPDDVARQGGGDVHSCQAE